MINDHEKRFRSVTVPVTGQIDCQGLIVISKPRHLSRDLSFFTVFRSSFGGIAAILLREGRLYARDERKRSGLLLPLEVDSLVALPFFITKPSFPFKITNEKQKSAKIEHVTTPLLRRDCCFSGSRSLLLCLL